MTHRATPSDHTSATPRRPTAPIGLYDPAFEHDSCGVALVARLDGLPAHETLERALTALGNLEHRGAAGADARTGDGAGVLIQLPDEFFRAEIGSELPRAAVTASPRASSPRPTARAAPSWSRSFSLRSRPRGSVSSAGARCP